MSNRRGSTVIIQCARRVALFLVIVCVVAARAASAGDGLLPNGNFEYPPDRSQMSGSRVTGEYAIPNWKISGFVEYIEAGQKQGDMVLEVPEGAHAVRLGHNDTIQQELTVTPGAMHSITFSAARTCAQHEKLSVSVVPGDGSGDEVPIQTVYSSSGWDYYCWAFLAKESAAVSFVIHNPVSEDDPACGPVIDSVAIKTLHPSQAIQGNMLRNGDFEEGPYTPPDSRSGVLVPPRDEDDVSPLPGWMIMSESKVVKYVDSPHFAVPHGSHAVELVAGSQAALVQQVNTVPWSSCALEFSVGDAADGCVAPSPGSPMRVQASTAYGTKTVQYSSQGTGGSTRARLDFTPTRNRTRVAFTSTAYHAKSDNSGTLCGPVVDDVSLVCVSPPPARRLLR